jgi:3-oxoacyl-[acyl-carrier-protein] synthase II
LIHCKSGIGPITRFDASGFPVKIAGEVKNFDMRDYFGGTCRPHRYSHQTQMGLVACKQALDQAGLTPEMLQQEDVIPVNLGVASSANHLIEHNAEILYQKGPGRMPLNVRAFPPGATAGAISHFFGFQASVTTISSCCPSGHDAVQEGVRMIRDGRTDIVLAGAVDSYVTPVAVASFAAINLTTTSTDFPPEEVCRPFDKHRTGVVFAEGAGIVVLERLDRALARGVTPLIEIVAGSRFTDSVTKGDLDGMLRSMDGALKNAAICPEDVDYICANAPSIPAMDIQEVKAIKEVFGDHAYRIPVSSIHGVTGHALASSALMQLATCIQTIKNDVVPPTANLTDPDPECDLNHVPLVPQRVRVNTAIANAHGMTAENTTLVLKRVR